MLFKSDGIQIARCGVSFDFRMNEWCAVYIFAREKPQPFTARRLRNGSFVESCPYRVYLPETLRRAEFRAEIETVLTSLEPSRLVRSARKCELRFQPSPSLITEFRRSHADGIIKAGEKAPRML